MRILILLSVLVLAACSDFTGPKPECHNEIVVIDTGSVVPPDSLHLPTITITITQTRRICHR